MPDAARNYSCRGGFVPETLPCTFFQASWDRHGIRAEPTWRALVARCSDHREGDKDGPALACATFTGTRGNANLESRSMVALDVEANPRTGEVPVSFSDCVDTLSAKRIRAVCWTTHSHTPDAPRYRIVMPLSDPIAYQADIDPYIAGSCAAQLGIHGVCDPSKFGAASLFYLPRHKPDSVDHASAAIEGDALDVGMLVTMATTVAEGVAQDMAAVAARRAANALPPEISARIVAYNETHAIADRLALYGYQRDGMRYRSRYQHGIGATTILPDGKQWVSFSESDAAAGVGTRPARFSSQCACWGDAFALFVHYEHKNNFRRALEALGQ